MNVVLIGFMGTGKTAVGKRLAKRLGWPFVDVDEQIESSARMPISRIFEDRGEPVFRRLERRIISRVVRGDHQVIATGGGAFLEPASRAKLQASGQVVCLTARPRTILERVRPKLAVRPLLARLADPLGRIKALLQQRAAAYAEADATVETSDLTVEEVVERVWRHISPCVCKSWQYLLDHAATLSHRYGGRYVVVLNDRVIGSGDTQLEAYRKAKLSRHRPAAAEPGIFYIPLPEESLTAL